MHICSKCGAEYNSNFLQCPQCGATRYEEATPETGGNKLVGAIISLVIIGGLIGIIAYGVYILYHPYVEESATSDIDWSTISTEPTTTIRQSTTAQGGSSIDTNGTKVAYQGHEVIIPVNYDYTAKLEGDTEYVLKDSETAICISNKDDLGEHYCFGLMPENYSINASSTSTINKRVNISDYDDIKTIRLSNGSYYYGLKKQQNSNEYVEGLIIYNKGANSIYNEFSIKGTELTKTNSTVIEQIFNNYK